MRPKSLIKLDGEFSFRPPAKGPSDVERILPLKRTVVGSLILGAFLFAFCLPYLSVGEFTDGSAADLFSLVSMMFMGFWLMGWSVAVGLIAVLFLATLFAQERLILCQGKLLLRFELFGVGMSRSFDGDDIKDLKRVEPEKNSAVAWRGPHMEFRFKTETVRFGSDVDPSMAGVFTDLVIRHVLVPANTDELEEQIEDEPQEELAESLKHLHEAKVELGSVSSVALIVANLIPLGGVVFLSWTVGDVLLLFWAESAVIGIYNLARMWVIGRWRVLFYGPFFLGHYGGFMVVHLLFIYGLMIPGGDASVSVSRVLDDFLVLYPALIALFISHGVSFYLNFLGRKEYETTSLQEQMSEPYKRIIVMHLTIIFGGFLVMMLDNKLPALVLMIVLKVGVDLRAHLGERHPEGKPEGKKEPV
jgi:hypothetical protein